MQANFYSSILFRSHKHLYGEDIYLSVFTAECGECLMCYPNVTENFEEINLEVIIIEQHLQLPLL